MAKLIYHFTDRTIWIKAQEEGEYEPASVKEEGFIHCCTYEQILETADKWASDKNDQILLVIDETKVNPDVKHEKTKGRKGIFPHVYGALNLESVRKVYYFKKGEEGKFKMPKALIKVDS